MTDYGGIYVLVPRSQVYRRAGGMGQGDTPSVTSEIISPDDPRYIDVYPDVAAGGGISYTGTGANGGGGAGSASGSSGSTQTGANGSSGGASSQPAPGGPFGAAGGGGWGSGPGTGLHLGVAGTVCEFFTLAY